MLESGRILQKRYRVEKQVGQGGMGSVYLATDERFHSTVAIKETLFADENLRKAFAREARLLNSLKHSALPKVTDHFIEDNGQYIVMEYIGGDDLFEMMRKSGQAFPVEDVLSWTEQLLDALTYLHDQGIIHRDIKPQNLKLTPRGDIVLLDFGLAKGNPTDANYQTAAQSIFGYSRNYASLEQIQGTGTDPRSDVYSLAATIYHLLTAQVPADALTRVMLVLNEGRDPLEPVGQLNSSLSQEISDGLNQCLALKSADRPNGVNAMRALLLTESQTPYSGTDSDAQTVSGRADLLTQNTQILDQEKGTAAKKPTEFVTEVLPSLGGNESVQTEFANLKTDVDPVVGTTASSGKAGKWGIAAALIVISGIFGTVAAFVAFWPEPTPTMTISNANSVNSAANVEEVNANVENANLDPLMSEGNSMPDNASNTAGSEAAVVQQPKSSKTAETTKSDRPVGSGTTSSPEVRIAEDGITTRDVKITDQGVVIRQATPRPNRPPPPLTREQFEALSPAERRRLRTAIEKQRKLEDERRKKAGERPPPPPN